VGRASSFFSGDSVVAALHEPGTSSRRVEPRIVVGISLFIFRYVTSGTRVAGPRRTGCGNGTFQATTTEELRLSYESASRQIGDARDKEMKSISHAASWSQASRRTTWFHCMYMYQLLRVYYNKVQWHAPEDTAIHYLWWNILILACM